MNLKLSFLVFLVFLSLPRCTTNELCRLKLRPMNALSFSNIRSASPVVLLGAAILAASFSAPARAAFTVIPQPDPAYVAATNVIDLASLAEYDEVTSVRLGTQTLSFDQVLEKRTVPGSWITWGAPPATESATPDVLYNAASRLEVELAQRASTLGLELEPEQFGSFPFQADFYSGSTLVGSILQSVEGNDGARLFAARLAAGFTRVVLENTGGDSNGFAVAQLRFGTSVPGPLPMLGAAAAFCRSRGLRKRLGVVARGSAADSFPRAEARAQPPSIASITPSRTRIATCSFCTRLSPTRTSHWLSIWPWSTICSISSSRTWRCCSST